MSGLGQNPNPSSSGRMSALASCGHARRIGFGSPVPQYRQLL